MKTRSVISSARGARSIRVPRALARLPWRTSLLAGFALLALQPELAVLFEWQRDLGREAWRVLTGHFCHWSVDHLQWDLAVFVVFGALLERREGAALLPVVIGSGLALGIALPLFHPAMSAYRGLSGIDCALAAALATGHLRSGARRDGWLGAAIGLVVTVKVAAELGVSGPLFVTSSSSGAYPFRSLPTAHALGALAGVAIALGLELFDPGMRRPLAEGRVDRAGRRCFGA